MFQRANKVNAERLFVLKKRRILWCPVYKVWCYVPKRSEYHSELTICPKYHEDTHTGRVDELDEKPSTSVRPLSKQGCDKSF